MNEVMPQGDDALESLVAEAGSNLEGGKYSEFRLCPSI
jgi:hypothetical protein